MAFLSTLSQGFYDHVAWWMKFYFRIIKSTFETKNLDIYISKKFFFNYLFLETLLHIEADSGLVKLVMMTNVFSSNQEHKIKIKRFICVKQKKSSSFSNS